MEVTIPPFLVVTACERKVVNLSTSNYNAQTQRLQQINMTWWRLG